MTRSPGLRKTLAEKFDDELKFFKGWIDKPKAVGSIVPTSSITAGKMASIVDPTSGLPVLEVGPGTGVITRAILAQGIKPENLYAVEYSTDFVRHLRQLYPGVNVIEGDAFNLDATLGDKRDLIFDSVISGVPLLNFPVAQRIAYVESLLDRIPAGRPIVQLTYGPLSPIPPGRGDYTVEHFHFVIRNIPPTQLWIYRRGAHELKRWV
ncbi:phospholipid N-methyltransferase PmtA [Mesorhizobium sp. M0684]|uniref:phospholipid N-methyltransferase PmtA n=1 Tax=unclassified Mesorhizobium TaxID=325217 RepID=UPI0033373CF1